MDNHPLIRTIKKIFKTVTFTVSAADTRGEKNKSLSMLMILHPHAIIIISVHLMLRYPHQCREGQPLQRGLPTLYFIFPLNVSAICPDIICSEEIGHLEVQRKQEKEHQRNKSLTFLSKLQFPL